MNSKESTIQQLFNQNKIEDFDERLKDYHVFMSTLIEFTDNLHTAQVKIEYWKKYLEIQLVKFSMHSYSLAYLIEGTPIRIKKDEKFIKYTDLGSIFLLGRAQIENYLMFYYLNIQPQTVEEGELRYLFYEVSGLSHRQQFNCSTPEQIQKKENERKEIESLINKIKNNINFQKLPPERQKQLLNSKPSRIIGWEKLIESSHLNTERFLNTWKLYSNYSHSEMIGSTQIKVYIQKPEELKKTLFTTLALANMLTCVTIKDLVKLFKTSEIIFNALPIELITKINFWWQLGMDNIKKIKT